MIQARELLTRAVIAAVAAGIGGVHSPALAQQRATQSKEGAAVIVEGNVREVFRSPRQTRVDYLVQIEVARSEYGRNPTDARRVQAPAPGDQIYVHIDQAGNAPQGRPASGGYNAVPTERSQIRAYLYARNGGGWEGAFPDWFDQVGAQASARGVNDPEPPAETSSAPPTTTTTNANAQAEDASILRKLGLRAEQTKVSGRLVLKVIDVTPDSPAAAAGIEKGDTIVGVNGGFISDIDHLTSAILKGGPETTLAVLDVRTSKAVPVKVNVSSILTSEAAQGRANPAPAPPTSIPGQSLGVKTENVRSGQTSAVRVTQVEEGSAAEKAGIERGDIIVEANGTPTGDGNALTDAVSKSGPILELKVYDSRTNRVVPVQVHLDAVVANSIPAPVPTPSTPTPAPAPTSPRAPASTGGGTSARNLGLTLEAGTADLLPVVKVVQVAPNSPAAKAGFEPGDAIVGLNDRVIFAPDLLDEALKSAGNSFTLSVLDVKTGRKTPVKITLP